MYKHIFRILSLYTMGIIFLPIVFANIPEPFGRTYFVGPIWILLILLWEPKLLLSKYLLIFYLFFLILSAGSIIIWDDRIIMGGQSITFAWIFRDLYGAFISILMYFYFIKSKDYQGLAWVVFITLIFIVITSATSILGITIFPGVVRQMASASSNINNLIYLKIGIADYSFFGSLVFIYPVIVYYLKSENVKISIKILLSFSIFISFYSLLKAEFTTAMLLAIMFFIYALFARKGVKKSNIFSVIILFSSFIILNDFFAEIFHFLSTLVDSDVLRFRLEDVSKVFELRDFDPSSNKTYFAESRLSLSYLSFEKFLENPIIGSGWGGGHATWLDRLGLFGLLGFFPWIVIFRQQIKLNLLMFEENYKVYYFISFFSLIVLGLITTTANSYQASASIFFLVPGMYFIRFIKRTNNSNYE